MYEQRSSGPLMGWEVPVACDTQDFQYMKKKVLKVRYKICEWGHFWNDGVRTSKNLYHKSSRQKLKIHFFRILEIEVLQQSKDYLFKKNSWISEQQALRHFDLPLFPALRSMTALKTNSLATTLGVKTSSLAATAGAE